MHSILTAFILELFWLECVTGRKFGFETNLEHRIKKYGLLTRDDLKDRATNAKSKNSSKLIKYFNSLISAISTAYDDQQPINYSSIHDIKFYIDFKGPVSIEILLQKYFSDEFEITNF
jgi:hypothetical protein